MAGKSELCYLSCLCFALFLLVSLLKCVQGTQLNLLKFEDSRPDSTFQQIMMDATTGNVFIGGRNNLYRLNSNLEQMQSIRTGPSMDAPWCSPNPSYPCNATDMMDNDASVLELYPTREFILFCGTVKQGLCTVYSPSNLEKHHNMDFKNKVNLLGSRMGTSVFFGNAGFHGSNKLALYAGMSYDGRPMSYSPKSVSSRVFNQNTFDSIYNMSFHYENPSDGKYSAIDITSGIKKEYVVEYIYGFEHEGFSYFVTVQKESLTSSSYVTRIARVCQNDIAFYSYTEILVICRKADFHTRYYNVATSAYFGSVGQDIATKYHIREEEKMLYIAFGYSHPGSSDPDPYYGSGVCMFSMTTLRNTFLDAQRYCYRGFGNLLRWIAPMGPKCRAGDSSMLVTMDEHFCGDSTNVGIGSRYPLTAVANVSSDHHMVTAIGVVTYKNKTVAVLGTLEGAIIKVLIDGTNSPPYAVINIGEGLKNPRVVRDIAFDVDQQHLFALTGNRVSKVPVQSCRVYNECSDCVTTKDPLDCGWCGNHCSTKAECTRHPWNQNSCPPVIYSFSPMSGPLQGGTDVTIQGRNFGADTSVAGVSTFVKVAFVDCPLIFKNTTVVICSTEEIVREVVREVSVTVVDRTQTTVAHDIEGPATSGHESYYYKNISVMSFSPNKGPRSGGTKVTITGKNLDIGAKLEILVTHMPCKPELVESTRIVCVTSNYIPELDYKFRETSTVPVSSSSTLPVSSTTTSSTDTLTSRRRRSLNEGSVSVSIDAFRMLAKGNFTYEADPSIDHVTPRESIMSGGIKITVTGYNLHVINAPEIAAMIHGEEHVMYRGPCTTKADGTSMTCLTPNVSATHQPVGVDSPIKASVFFIMDGVADLRNFPETHPNLSKFTYVIDPVVHRFSSDDNMRVFYMHESHLDIQGQNLDLIELKHDVHVKVGQDPCNITQLGRTILICEPLRPKDVSDHEPARAVQVKVGNLYYSVGFLIYSDKSQPDILIAAITVPMALVCLIIFIMMVMWMKKKRKGPFKPVPRDEPVVHYTRGNIVDIGGSGREQVYRLHNHENRYMAHGQARYRGPTTSSVLDSIMDDESRRLIEDAHLLIERQNLLLLEVIGQGHFGCVYRGCLKQEGTKEEVEVAVKTLKSLTESNYVSSMDGKKFLEEALRMREFDHPRILRLIGITLDKDELPLVVLPFMSHGDLLSYIRDETNSPTVKELMDYGTQVSEGMAYLSSLKFVHRDLAARNCMLDDTMNVKVADFGLSRDIYERDYYSSDDRKAKLPVKWMALESLEKGIYNIKTDVWSYGVVLWELMTRGVCPYPEVDNWDIIKYLKQGRRMPQPSYCPDGLYDIMLQCWQEDPKLRPSFDDLVFGVRGVIAGMEKTHQKVGLNVTYVNVPTTQSYLYPHTGSRAASRAASPEAALGAQAQAATVPILTILHDSNPALATPSSGGSPVGMPEGQAMSTLV